MLCQISILCCFEEKFTEKIPRTVPFLKPRFRQPLNVSFVTYALGEKKCNFTLKPNGPICESVSLLLWESNKNASIYSFVEGIWPLLSLLEIQPSYACKTCDEDSTKSLL